MTLPGFTRTLHFRLSALFLLLLAVSAVGYYIWINATVFRLETAPGEDRWYEELAEAELDSLARKLTPHLGDRLITEAMIVEYGRRVAHYDVELALLAGSGELLTSSSPDSLSRVLLQVDPALLDSMSTSGWDFGSYPNPNNIDAYENRIFNVTPVFATPDSTPPPQAYLAASFTPLDIQPGEMERDNRRLLAQAVTVILMAAALSGMIIMAWISRRIRTLSTGVAAFREGQLSHRVPVRSADEIGQLGQNFNSMASRLEALIERLRLSDRFHRRLIANISHDLRTPLASLQGYVETLTLQGDRLPPADRDRYLQIIKGNLEHLERLISHLLQLSQLESGQAQFHPEDFSLEELVGEVLDRFQGLAADRGIALVTEVEGELPAVQADPLQIGQALQNLVENGIKFSETGGRVTLSLRGGNDGVSVEVRDTGQGIAPEDLPHIFERFYTADKSRSRKGQSSGLGLAITKKILEQHQLELDVASRPGEGTTFSFVLPAAPTGD